MKRIFFFILMAMSVLLQVTACSKSDDNFNPDDQKSDETQFDGNRKILVAYFSGTGNTQRLANQIVEATGADVFRIEAAEPYAPIHTMIATVSKTNLITIFVQR